MTNPFEVLGLDPATPLDEIVRHAGQQRQRAADEERVAAIRQAVQALTGPPDERLLHELLTHPAPQYHWPALEAFVSAFRRLPQTGEETPQPCPPLDLDEVKTLLRPLASEELTPPLLPFEPLGDDEDAEEIRRQTVEGIWQTLPFHPEA